ncbi:hypothetical protein PENTCL1PPCAC_9104, partial [Pristionchus entomophagus]
AKTVWLDDWERQDLFPEDTVIHQVEDGTIFYHKHSSPERLYVKRTGKELEAELPEGIILGLHVHWDSIYFCASDKIYQASFSASTGISVAFLRDRLEDETIYEIGLCSRTRYDTIYVYEMSEDPDRDGIASSLRNVEGYKLIGYHQYGSHGKVIYAKKSLNDTQICVDEDRERIFLELPARSLLPRSWPCFSRFFYLIHGRHLTVYDTFVNRFLPPLGIDGTTIHAFVGVHNGVITVQDLDCYVKTHQLPDTYFDIGYDGERMSVQELIDRNEELEIEGILWRKEREELIRQNRVIDEMLIEVLSRLSALQSVMKPLQFQEVENLTKPVICFQLENGHILYFDYANPFELYTVIDGVRFNANMDLLDGVDNVSLRGTIGNNAYFSTDRGKIIKFFRATANDGTIEFEQISEMDVSDLSLFHNQPFYFIERAKNWSVYQYHENYTDLEGEKVEISEIDLLSKYERHYHRGVLYLFREKSIASVTRVNEKVVKVEGPLLHHTVRSHWLAYLIHNHILHTVYTPHHSNSIYILNSKQNILLILDTLHLHVSQLNYEPPADSNTHTIVGIHDGILTMAFDGVWGRYLSTTKLPYK